MERTIGRSEDCSIVILDPQNRVSRNHAVLKSHGAETYIRDEGSSNGTYVNGRKIPSRQYVKLNHSDKVTLARDYVFEFSKYAIQKRDDETMVLGQSHEDRTVIFDKDRITITENDKTIMFDPNKTAIGDLAKLDQAPYKIIGRGVNNHFVVKNANVSREHCKIRMLTPLIIEIEDLGSANGTYADGVKLKSNKKYRFSSSVDISLSNLYNLNLKEIFTEIQVLEKRANGAHNASNQAKQTKGPITEEEKAAYLELEGLWNEYNQRNIQNSKEVGNIQMGASLAGIAGMGVANAAMAAGSVAIPGAGMIVSAGIGLIGKYLSQKKSNEIRSDLTYENMFLESYCCPRCKESFQKKPWVTIRDCNKCKLSFK